MSFRKEIKYRVSSRDLLRIKGELLNRGLGQLYPSRWIHSTYFDTHDLDNYRDSEEGLLPRKKIRIRNYSSDSTYLMETKISSTEGRYKKSEKMFKSDAVRMLKKGSSLILGGRSVRPSLNVCYNRWYGKINGVRCTFDSGISYSNPRVSKIFAVSDPECVIEFKCPESFNEDFINEMVDLLPSRFSKYCRGITMIYQNKRNDGQQIHY